jgi:disulfide bond formation protein DsbB
MNSFFQHLNSPEYMHVLLNPIPVYGLAIGLVGLLLAIIARSRTAIVIALALVFLSGLSAWPTYHYGQAAYDRVTAMADTAGDQWLDEHMARGEKLIYAFYILAGLAVAGMFAPMKWSRASLPLAIVTLVIGCATLGIGGYIAYAGGHVRHKEFRFEPPPPKRAEEDHHEH